MAKSTFVLKEPNAKTKTPIYVVFRWEDNSLKILTKQKVNPEYWNTNKQRVKTTIKVSNHNEINKELSSIESILNKIFEKFIERFDRKPIKEEIKNLFDLEYFQKNPQFKKVEHKRE